MDGDRAGVQLCDPYSWTRPCIARVGALEPKAAVARNESVMTELRSPPDPARDREDADRRTAGLAAIVVVLLLLIGGLLLTKTLHKKSMLEDCLMAGHRNCDQLIDK
jgi:hypothetical protein